MQTVFLFLYDHYLPIFRNISMEQTRGPLSVIRISDIILDQNVYINIQGYSHKWFIISFWKNIKIEF